MEIKNSKWLIFWVVGAANFIAGFSINSMNLALPTIASQFGVSQASVSWLSLLYNLIPCCTLLFFGRLGDMLGYRKQFMFGFALFGAVSWLAPLCSRNLGLLILFRSLQGLGYSILVSITQAIVKRTFGREECGKAIGINSVFVSIGLAAGPTCGGFLIDFFSWHSIFYVNIPFCIAGFIAAMLVLPADSKTSTKVKIDTRGTVFFAVFTGTFITALNNSNSWGGHSVKFLSCMVIAAASLVLFIRTELNSQVYLLPLKLFKIKDFTYANAVCICSYFTQQSVIYLMPFFLIKVLGLTATEAGMIMLLSPVTMMIFSPVGGTLSDRLGTKKSASIGLAIICASIILICFSDANYEKLTASIAMLLMGTGNGFSVAAINACILCSVPEGSAGTASAMIGTLRNFGQSLGIATGTAIIAAREQVYMASGDSSAYLHAHRDAFIFTMLIITSAFILTRKLSEKRR